MRPLRLNEEVSHAGNERMGGVLGLKDLLRCERSLSKGQRARICKDKGEWGRLDQNLEKEGRKEAIRKWGRPERGIKKRLLIRGAL